MNRITRLHVGIVGAILILLTAALAYFLFIKNIQAARDAEVKYQEDIDAQAAQLEPKKKAKLDAFMSLKNAEEQHRKFKNRNPNERNGFPPIKPTDPLSRWRGLVHLEQELITRIGPTLRRAMREIALRSGVRVTSGTWAFVHPASSPTAAFQTNPISSTGNFTVVGPYPNIKRFMLALRTAPRIITIGSPISIDASTGWDEPGKAGWVTATMPLTVYEFVPGIPETGSGGGAAAGGGPGGMGGMPGGMGGMPSGMGGYPGMPGAAAAPAATPAAPAPAADSGAPAAPSGGRRGRMPAVE